MSRIEASKFGGSGGIEVLSTWFFDFGLQGAESFSSFLGIM